MSTQSLARKQANQRYRAKNRELINAKERERRKAKPYVYEYQPRSDSTRNSFYKHRYGITLNQYQELVQQQDNKCAICEQEESAKTRYGPVASLCVDHDHDTDMVRGLLCRMCNSALGKFKDSPDLLDKAKSYLLHHGKESSKPGIN